MSFRLGKSRDPSGLRTIQVRPCSGRKITAVFFCFILFSGCAVFEKNKTLSYKELLSYICTGGEGKGRLKIFDKSYSFGFESHTTEKKLTLGLQIPFHGEEMLVIEFEPQIKVTGSFYHLISKEIQDKEEFQSLLKRVFYVYGYSLKSLQGEKDRDLFVYEKGRLTFKNPKQGVAVSHSRLKKHYFSHQSINMQIDGETVAMVDMVYKKCYEAFFKSL